MINKQKMNLYNQLRQTKMLWVMIMFIGFMAILPMVSAFDWTKGINLYYNFNSSKELVSGVYNLTENEGTFNFSTTNALIGSALRTTTGNNALIPNNPNNAFAKNRTVNFWVRKDSIGAGEAFFSSKTANVFGFSIDGGAKTYFSNYLGLPTQDFVWNSGFSAATWYMITITHNDSRTLNTTIYINGAVQQSPTGWSSTADDRFDNFNTGDAIAYILGANINSANDWNGNIDEYGSWNRSLNSSEIAELYNSGAGITYEGTAPPPSIEISITLNKPTNAQILTDVGTNFTASFNITSTSNYTWINATYYVWKEDVAFNTTNVNLGRNVSNLTSSLYIDNFVIGNYKWIVYGTYGNNTFSNTTLAVSNYTYVVGASLQSLSYNMTTYETSRETFRANFTMLPNSQISSIQFVYNGNNYSVTSFNVIGDSITLTKSIDIPLNINPYANETKNFNFKFTYAGNSVQESAVYQQNVSFINLQICNATYPTITLNFTVKNETFPLARITNFIFGGNFNYWIGTGNIKKTMLIQNSSSNEFNFCLYPNWITLKTNADMDYSAGGFSQRSYYLRQATLNNNTNNITLYLLDNLLSTSIIVNVKDKYLTNLKTHFVKVLKYYPGLGAYYLVEIAKTDDFGNALIKAQEEDTDYRIQIENSTGNQVYASNPMRIICTASPCQLEFITGITEHIVQELVDFANVEYTLTWNNNTGYVNFEFSDSSGLTQSMRLWVVKRNNYGDTTICDNTLEGSSGISSCYIGANATGEYMARVYRTASPGKYFAILNIGLANTWQIFGTEGLVWMLLFVVVMFFTGLAVGPAAAAIMTGVSIVLMMATGIVYMPWIIVASIFVVIIIFIIKMRS